MLALRSSAPVISGAEAERIARQFYGLAVIAHPLPGERDANFRLSTGDHYQYVLKVTQALEAGNATDCLVRVLRHLEEVDPFLPVPRLHATLQGGDWGAHERNGELFATCLFGHLSGQLLIESTASPPLLNGVGGVLARVDRALQGFFHPSLGQALAWDVRRLPQLLEFSALIGTASTRRDVERAAALFAAEHAALKPLRSQAIHGDCHGGNLLIEAASESVSGILDFGDMMHAPVITELATAMAELLIDGLLEPQALVFLVQGYARDQRPEAADIAVLYPLILARHAVTILLHAWRSARDAAGAALLDASAARATQSLSSLLSGDRAALTMSWHQAAGTAPVRSSVVTLERRHRLMGQGAELFYDQPLHLVRGEDVWLFDAHGRPYLDVYNNVPHVGHCHPLVVRAIQRQTAILATHTRYLHGGILDYAADLTARCPVHLDACIFVNSGSEANDVAWRLAQFATGHRGALIMANAYHGVTEAVAALTPGTGEPHDPRVARLAAPSQDSAAAAEDADAAIELLLSRGIAPAAFFLDTAITSSGIFDPSPSWAAAVTARIRDAGCLMVADEVQYGLGRAGSHFWGFERRGLVPDIVTLGKPVGNGYPMGVVIANRVLIEAFQARFGFFSTFGGNAVAAAAGRAVLEVLDRERLVANAQSTGAYLARRLAEVASRHECLGEVRGAGLLLGLEVRGRDVATARARTKTLINELAAQARILIGYEGPDATLLKLRPPMTFRPEHADLLAQAIDAAAAALPV